MRSKLTKNDNGLLGVLRIDLRDYERGESGVSKCPTVQISKERYIRMAELAVKQLESMKPLRSL